MLTSRKQLLVEIETARMRHAWAVAQVEGGVSTLAIAKYVDEAFEEWRVLTDRLRRRK